MSNYIDSIQLSGTVYTLSAQTGGGGTVSSAITSGDTNAVAGGAVYDKFDEVETVTARALNDLEEKKLDASAYTPTDLSQYWTSAQTNSAITQAVSGKANSSDVYLKTETSGATQISTALNGKQNATVELTQAEYDDLAVKDPNTFYVISDATAFDPTTKVDTSAFTAYSAATNTALNNKVDTSAITSSVTSASTNSQIPTAKAVYDAIPTGGTSGGKAIEAGRGISVTTGETADTVSFDLPISASSKSTGNYINIGVFYDFDSILTGKFQNISIGSNNIANSNTTIFHGSYNTSNGNSSFISGYGCQTNGLRSNAFGYYIVSNNENELSTGKYNASNTGSNDADKTIFSVGNGTSSSSRHNAFEIRQNGDIYLSSGGTDIKLQDYLGGTASSAITSGDTNAVAGGAVYAKLDEMEQVIARALNDLNDRITAIENQLNNNNS